MMPKIYLMDDDKKLVQHARMKFELRGYDFEEIDISQVNKISYWSSREIKPHDLVILDLNLIQAGVRSSGLDVLRLLQDEKRKGKLKGLEKVLVATSVKDQVNPKSPYPEIGMVEAFKVYGMEKGVSDDRTVAVIDYGTDLVKKVERIYGKTEIPLNEP